MPKSKQGASGAALKPSIWMNTAGVLIICLSAVGLAGFFSAGGAVGRGMAGLFQSFLGRSAWIGPFITALIGFFLVIYRSQEKPRVKEPQAKEKPQKSAGKDIVTKGRGFNTYFADDDPLNEHKQTAPAPDLEDIGKDFNSYFGSAQSSQAKLVMLGNKFADYFDENQAAPVEEKTVSAVVELPPDEAEVPVRAGGLRGFINRASGRKAETGPEKDVQPREKPVIPFPSAPPKAEEEAEPEANPMAHWRREPREIAVPPAVLLDPPVPQAARLDGEAQQNGQLLEEVLNNFGVKIKVTEISQGPAITRYEVQPAPGIKISRIVNLADDMALALAAPDVRIEAPIPGKSAVGIEVPNKKVNQVKFREVLEADEFKLDSKLKVALGKDIAGKPVVADLARMPHLLVAGATGSGKSVCMNTIISSILYTALPHEVKFLLIDPKMVELAKYNGIPHLIAPVVTDPKKAAAALRWIVNEMENRYELFAAAGVRDINRYNEVIAPQPALPYIVVLIDELADLMLVAPGDVEEAICRLAQMARAAGIHLVVATQRPSVDVITGIIKANIPSRIAFAVSSQIDSRTILDGNGAEKLLGKGDMLYYPLGMAKPLRVQGCFLSDQEVERVVKHWKGQAQPEYLTPDFADQVAAAGEEMADDELFAEAARLFITSNMASVSLLQRRLRVGYTRAARLMDLLEQKGVVGGFEGSKPRQVLMTLEEFKAQYGD